MALIGYNRVLTAEQDTTLQLGALHHAGCARIFEDTISGVKAEHSGLGEALAILRKEDVLVVWRLDRLGCSPSPTSSRSLSSYNRARLAFARLRKASTKPPLAGSWCFISLVP